METTKQPHLSPTLINDAISIRAWYLIPISPDGKPDRHTDKLDLFVMSAPYVGFTDAIGMPELTRGFQHGLVYTIIHALFYLDVREIILF